LKLNEENTRLFYFISTENISFYKRLR